MDIIDYLETASTERIAKGLGCGISASLVETLKAEPRFRGRLAELLASRLQKIESVNQAQAGMLAKRSEALADLAMKAGVIWHARALVRIIDGASRRRLVTQWGERTIDLALRHAQLSPKLVPDHMTAEAISDAAPGEGAACLAAWVNLQPAAVAVRLMLLAPEAQPLSKHMDFGPPIIDLLAQYS